MRQEILNMKQSIYISLFFAIILPLSIGAQSKMSSDNIESQLEKIFLDITSKERAVRYPVRSPKFLTFFSENLDEIIHRSKMLHEEQQKEGELYYEYELENKFLFTRKYFAITITKEEKSLVYLEAVFMNL